MIYIESKKKKQKSIEKKYPNAVICDLSSKATNSLIAFSPLYPHGNIPIPMSEGCYATCVEAIWQGLKVFESADIDTKLFSNDKMKNLKRTVRKYGRPLGHRAGVNGKELLGYIEARKKIYIPAYRWVLENKCMSLISHIRKAVASGKDLVFLDYDCNSNVEDTSKPLSHASLVKAYVEGIYPYSDALGLGDIVIENKSIEADEDPILSLFDKMDE